jgi:dUTP pyrophosphatase
MTSVIVKIINKSPFPLPAYETVHSAGMDLRADIQEPVELKPLQRNATRHVIVY